MSRSWSSSHHGTEYRLIMTGVLALCAAGAAGSVVPGLDTTVSAVLIGAVLAAVGVAVVRREARIRRRIADTDGLRYWPRTPGGAPETRVGPGDGAPVLPAPTCRPARALTVVPTSSATSPAAPAPSRPSTPSGGAA